MLAGSPRLSELHSGAIDRAGSDTKLAAGSPDKLSQAVFTWSATYVPTDEGW
jgi:hypothetical protein